jgi:5'(3')-deoxyribonucleotidase
MMVKTIAVDFDGVLHQYSKGWQDGSIYDPPMPGALDAIKILMDKYAVFCHTTRDPYQVTNWLIVHGIRAEADENPERNFWSDQGTILVTNKKLVAIAFIDDRAIKFENWSQAMNEVGKLY